MNTILLLVVIAGLVIGYTLVSWLMGKTQIPPASQDSPQAGAPEGPSASPPHWSVVLGVEPDASPEQIRDAYRRLIGEYHPYKVASLGPEIRAVAERKTKEIVGAFQAATGDRRQ